MGKKTDKRIHFIAQALNRGIVTDADLANRLYISMRLDRVSTDEALKKLKEAINAAHA